MVKMANLCLCLPGMPRVIRSADQMRWTQKTGGRLATVILCPLLLAARPAAAAQTGCVADTTDVRVIQNLTPPRIDVSKTAEQMKTMRTEGAITTDSKFAETTGLTVAAIGIDSEVRTTSTGHPGGPFCLTPSVITLTLSTAPVIYVDASHGACRQGVAVEHEMEHVAIDRRLIERYVPIFRRRVTDMAAAIGTVSSLTEDGLPTLRRRIEEKVEAVLSVTYDALTKERISAQRGHDSQEEYRRISAACPTVSVNAAPVAPHSRSTAVGGT